MDKCLEELLSQFVALNELDSMQMPDGTHA
jgi:hypothetical protein